MTKLTPQTVYVQHNSEDKTPSENGRYFVITDNEFKDGNVFIDGWLAEHEVGKTTQWLEEKPNQYIFSKQELIYILSECFANGVKVGADENNCDNVNFMLDYINNLFQQ